jgi:hypothetical protein
VGERLWSADRSVSAEVQADTSLVCDGMTGSIHSLGTIVSGRERTNGWSYWHAEREEELVSIDELRKEYRKSHQC